MDPHGYQLRVAWGRQCFTFPNYGVSNPEPRGFGGLPARSKPSRRQEAHREQSARGGYKPRRDPRIRSPPKAALIAFRIAGN